LLSFADLRWQSNFAEKNSANVGFASAALYLGQFVSPLIVMPMSKGLFGDDITGPYKAGCLLSIVFLLQVWATRHFQSLPPQKD
jgi:hypothetical protein